MASSTFLRGARTLLRLVTSAVMRPRRILGSCGEMGCLRVLGCAADEGADETRLLPWVQWFALGPVTIFLLLPPDFPSASVWGHSPCLTPGTWWSRTRLPGRSANSPSACSCSTCGERGAVHPGSGEVRRQLRVQGRPRLRKCVSQVLRVHQGVDSTLQKPGQCSPCAAMVCEMPVISPPRRWPSSRPGWFVSDRLWR